MKKLLAFAIVLSLALCVFAMASAETPPPPPPPPAPPVVDATPPPPPPPPAPVKVATIMLSKAQLDVAKKTAAGADVTLSKNDIKNIVKVFADFKGTTAKVVLEHVTKAKKVDLTVINGAAVSVAAAVTPPTPPKKEKGKDKDKPKDPPKGDQPK